MDEDRPAEFSSYATRSVAEAHDVIAAHYYDLHLQVTGPVSEFTTRLSVVDLGALVVGDVGFGTEVRMSFGEPGVYHVAVPLDGCFSVQQGHGDAAFATTRHAAFFDPGRDIRVDAWSPDCHALTVKIDKAALHHQLELLLGRPVRRPPRFEPYLDVRRPRRAGRPSPADAPGRGEAGDGRRAGAAGRAVRRGPARGHRPG